MKTRTPEAAHLEQDYLARLRAMLGGRPAAEAEAILQDVRDHIESALGESAAEPVSLTAMAAVFERLGPPETCAAAEESARARPPSPAPPVPAAGVASAVDGEAWAGVIDRLWWAFLVTTIGLYVPVIEFAFCDIAGIALVLAAVRRLPAGAPDDYRTLAPHGVIAIVLLLLTSPLIALSHIAPLLALAVVPVAVAAFAWELIVYAKCMGGAAALLEGRGRADLARSVRTSRAIYIGSCIGVTVFMIGVVLVVALVTPAGRREGIDWPTEILSACVMLPIGWVLGAFFALRPLGQVRAALRETAAA